MSDINFPEGGQSEQEVLNQLEGFKAKDVPWKTGKVMAYIYATDPAVKALAEKAYAHFFTENGLDPSAFPSLLQLEREVVSAVAQLLGGSKETAGNCTSGGTESVMLAIKSARDYARDKYPAIKEPEVVIPSTAHPCFHKAGHYLGVKMVSVAVSAETFKADVADMEAAITEQTIMLVGSAPSYAHGVLDPIEGIAALAQKHELLCHVDACVGGMYLPFLRMLGEEVPAFDFEVAGVTSMSCDLHKFGYVPKGCSTILYRDKSLREYQFFASSLWPGYSIVNPTVLSSKTGGPMAGAWAMFQHFGKQGYQKAVQDCQAAKRQLEEGLAAIPQLKQLGKPIMGLVAFASTSDEISVFDLAERMKARGWYLQIQLASANSPQSIHVTITHFNAVHIPELVEDLKEVITDFEKEPSTTPELLQLFAPEQLQMLMADFSPDMLDTVEEMLGMETQGGLPDDMVLVNHVLNSLGPNERDTLLKAFVNRMFMAEQ